MGFKRTPGPLWFHHCVLMVVRRYLFFLLIQILIEYSVSKQWKPLSDAKFCGIWSGLHFFLTRKAYMYTFIQNSPRSRAQISLFSLVTCFTTTVYCIPISPLSATIYFLQISPLREMVLQPQFIAYPYQQ